MTHAAAGPLDIDCPDDADDHGRAKPDARTLAGREISPPTSHRR